MSQSGRSTTARDVITLLLFFVVGTPMAYFIWHAFSDLLRGIVNPLDLAIALVLLVVFFFFARLLGAVLQRMAGLEA